MLSLVGNDELVTVRMAKKALFVLVTFVSVEKEAWRHSR